MRLTSLNKMLDNGARGQFFRALASPYHIRKTHPRLLRDRQRRADPNPTMETSSLNTPLHDSKPAGSKAAEVPLTDRAAQAPGFTHGVCGALDRKDKRGWQAQAIACRTKYVRLLKRTVIGHVRWFCQLVQQGQAPHIHETKKGVVGLDFGPSTIAAVSSTNATLEQLSPGVVQPWQESQRLQRAIDRSRRASNPQNFNPNGTIKAGPKK